MPQSTRNPRTVRRLSSTPLGRKPILPRTASPRKTGNPKSAGELAAISVARRGHRTNFGYRRADLVSNSRKPATARNEVSAIRARCPLLVVADRDFVRWERAKLEERPRFHPRLVFVDEAQRQPERAVWFRLQMEPRRRRRRRLVEHRPTRPPRARRSRRQSSQGSLRSRVRSATRAPRLQAEQLRSRARMTSAHTPSAGRLPVL
jgi:hypothetical protein